MKYTDSFYNFVMNPYSTLSDTVKEICPVKVDKWGIIESAYISSQDEFDLYFAMCVKGKASIIHGPEDFGMTYYRGTPDWYFVEGEGESRESPSTLCFVTLEEKKEDFNAFVKELDQFPSADVVEVVRCKDCRYYPTGTDNEEDQGFGLQWPFGELYKCPFMCDDGWYSRKPKPDFFCANGERG